MNALDRVLAELAALRRPGGCSGADRPGLDRMVPWPRLLCRPRYLVTR